MSKLADAAYSWLLENAGDRAVPSADLWKGLQKAFPALTTASEHRKTPRTTLMRDLRVDKAKRFIVESRTVKLAGKSRG